MYKKYLILLITLMSVSHLTGQIYVPVIIEDPDETTSCHIKKSDGKYHLENQNGKILWDNLDSISQDRRTDNYMVMRGDKQGVLSELGESLIPIEYNHLHRIYSNKLWLVEKNNKKGIYSNNYPGQPGEEVLPCIYNTIEMVVARDGARFTVQHNDKWGILGEKGEIILPIVYDDVKRISEIVYQLKKEEKKSYLFNFKTIIDSIDINETFSIADKKGNQTSVFVISCNDKKGILDNDGNALTPFKYDDIKKVFTINGLPGNVILAQRDSLWGIIDFNQHIVVPFKYKYFEVIDSHYAILGKSRLKHLYNLTTKKHKKEYDFENFHYYSLDYSRITKDGKETIIDNKDDYKMIFPLKYEDVSYQYNKFIARKKGKYGIVDKNNKIIIPFIYDRLNFFCEDKIVVEQNKMYGVLSVTENRLLIPMTQRIITAYSGSFTIRKEDSYETESYDCNLCLVKE